MSKQFIKGSSGLEVVGKPKTPIYKSVADAVNAIENGELEVGQLFATEFVGQGGDLSADMETISANQSSFETYANETFQTKNIPDLNVGVETVTTVEDGLNEISNVIPESTSSSNKLVNASQIITAVYDPETFSLTFTLPE